MKVKERPILFSGVMADAVVSDRKTQTRRLFKAMGRSVFKEAQRLLCLKIGVLEAWLPHIEKCPYGKPRDRLYVRETWSVMAKTADDYTLVYKADYAKGPEACTKRVVKKSDLNAKQIAQADRACEKTWTPSIHMPRWASRTLLEVVKVRFERLKDITESDAKAEGVEPNTPGVEDGEFIHYGRGLDDFPAYSALESFESLWDSLNLKRGFAWITNPWVWVIEFRRIEL